MYTLDWIVEQRILFLRYEGELTGAEMEALSDEFAELMDAAVAPLHIIEDDRELKSISGLSLEALRQALGALDLDKLQTTVAIVPEGMQEISDILGKGWELLTGVDYERVQTLPQALQYVDQHDATLPDRSEWELALA